MKICVVTDRRRDFSAPLPECDVVLFGFSRLGEVDYGNELSGKSCKLEEMTEFSKREQCGVFCGCITDSRGYKRKSVAVAASGRLLGISDMLYVLDGEEYKSGASVGVYCVAGCKAGVCIGSDLRFPECIKACAMCGCNLICAYEDDITDGTAPLLIRAYSYLYGVPVVMCAGGAAFFADITGAMASSNRDVALFETSPKNCYRTVSSRRKGLFCGYAPDF